MGSFELISWQLSWVLGHGAMTGGLWAVDCSSLAGSIANFFSFSWLADTTSDGGNALVNLFVRLKFIAQLAIGLGFVIFIHELGHFLAAKTFGVRCDKFYVGFDVPIRIGPIRFPRTLGKFQWGETEYGIGIIPLGGYVKMLGQDDDPTKAREEADKIRQGGGPDAPLDPRSYPAKPVWQRMIIISAGVVMNLVSAVFLAAWAYYLGVQYSPSVIGKVNAGSPAWAAGFEPGDRILQVGSGSDVDQNLRWPDLIQGVVSHGLKNGGEPLEVQVDRDGSTVTLHPVPSPRYDPRGEFFLLGCQGEASTEIAVDGGNEAPLFAGLDQDSGNARPAISDLKAGDRIVAVDGERLQSDSLFGHAMARDLRQVLQSKWNQPVTLTIERKPAAPERTWFQSTSDSVSRAFTNQGDATANEPQTAELFEVSLPPIPRNTLGLGFEMGPVTAVRPGSIGEAAGFQKGDQIIAIDGEPITDSFRLPELFASKAGQEVRVNVLRQSTDEATATKELVVQSPATPVFDMVSQTGSGELALGGIGVAFDVTSKVAYVDTNVIQDNRVQVGDRLVQYRWVLAEEEYAKAKKKYNVKEFTKPKTLDSFYNVVSFDQALQDLPLGSKFDCHFDRDGKMVNADLTTKPAIDSHRAGERGLELKPLSSIHRTSRFTEAMSLGFWETVRRFRQVIDFLGMLFTGQVGMGGVAGPVKLVEYAAHEAGFGWPRLLLFLTMLSANLAILNFLPIPALDGGHMMFLIAEAIRGKPLNEELQIKLTMVGVLGLLALMAFVILKDLYSYVS